MKKGIALLLTGCILMLSLTHIEMCIRDRSGCPQTWLCKYPGSVRQTGARETAIPFPVSISAAGEQGTGNRRPVPAASWRRAA